MNRLFLGLRSQGPVFVCAPMVAQSELAFRLLVRRHGVHLAFTPMMNAGCLVRGRAYFERNFDGGKHAADRPLVAQVAGNCPDAVAAAARALAATGGVDGIDLNLGCPQRCARPCTAGRERSAHATPTTPQPHTTRTSRSTQSAELG